MSLQDRGFGRDDLIFAMMRACFTELSRLFAHHDPLAAEAAITSIEVFFESQFSHLGRDLVSPADLQETAIFLRALMQEARDGIEALGKPEPE